MKQLTKPFSEFWYGKDSVNKNKQSGESKLNDSADDQYHNLKRAIQQEALRKWKQRT
jgi:hypothetical protein